MRKFRAAMALICFLVGISGFALAQKKGEEFKYTLELPCQVIGKGEVKNNQFYDYTILVDKGSLDGLEANTIVKVISPGGHAFGGRTEAEIFNSKTRINLNTKNVLIPGKKSIDVIKDATTVSVRIQKTAPKLFVSGKKKLDEKKYEDAVKDFEENLLTAKDKDNYIYHLWAGIAYAYAEKMSEARSMFDFVKERAKAGSEAANMAEKYLAYIEKKEKEEKKEENLVIVSGASLGDVKVYEKFTPAKEWEEPEKAEESPYVSYKFKNKITVVVNSITGNVVRINCENPDFKIDDKIFVGLAKDKFLKLKKNADYVSDKAKFTDHAGKTREFTRYNIPGAIILLDNVKKTIAVIIVGKDSRDPVFDPLWKGEKAK